MMGNKIWLFFTVVISYFACDAYKILTAFPVPSKSHQILADGLIRHLLNAGHEVTHITPFIQKDARPNLRQIDVSRNMNIFNESSMDIKAIMNKQLDLKDLNFLNEMMSEMSIQTLENPNVVKLMRNPAEKFDLVIGEWMFSDTYCVFPAVFSCPFIWLSTIEPHWLVLSLIDEPLNPAYNSDYGDLLEPPFTFRERVQGLWNQMKGLWIKSRFYYKEEAAYLRTVVPILKQKGRPVPSYQELRYNASLMLGNSHESLGSPTRLPVNYKHIAGYHIDDHAKPLPEDLKKIMDNAKNGVIYFSMGSNLKSKDLPDDMKKGLLEVFGGLKQTVIWKFEETLPNVPKNVHIVQWTPQPRILAHPNCKLFITHGGLLSLTESIHHGVPVVAIPVFADQFVNAARAAFKGYGVQLELTYSLHKHIKPAIDEVLGNAKYAQKAKELSFIYHDRLATPGAELLHWVNHVIRTNGAPHLRSPALDVPFYQKMYLDLLAVVIVLLIVVNTIIQRLLCTVTIKKLDTKKHN